MKKAEYKIKKKHNNPDDVLISKKGYEEINAEFTIGQVLAQIKQFEKTVKEKNSQMSIHQAEMDNVMQNHPKLKNIDEKLLQAAYVYIDSKIKYESSKQVRDQHQDAIDRQTEEIEEIRKELKLPTSVDLKDLETKK